VDQTSSETSNAVTGPKGIKGWLLLLVVGLMLLGPLVGATRLGVDIDMAEQQYPVIKSLPEWKAYKTATWWAFFIATGISFYGGLSLARGHDWPVVKRAKAILWVTGPVASIVMALVIPAVIFGQTLTASLKVIGGIIGSVIAAGIWTAYLSKSKRVRNTYGRHKHTQSAPEIKAQFQIKEKDIKHSGLSMTFPKNHGKMSLGPSSNLASENILDKKNQQTLRPTTSSKFIRIFWVSFYYTVGYLLLCTVANVIGLATFPGRGLKAGGDLMVTGVNLTIIGLLLGVHRGTLWLLRYMRIPLSVR
jgi:hypothetical protein